jgi:hypothetical protein
MPHPRVLRAAWMTAQMSGQFLCREPGLPGFEPGRFSSLAGGQKGFGLGLGIEQGLFLGGNVAFGPPVVAILGQGPKSPGIEGGHGLTLLVHELAMGQFVLDMIQSLQEPVNGFSDTAQCETGVREEVINLS